jgi:hypothetical protein
VGGPIARPPRCSRCSAALALALLALAGCGGGSHAKPAATPPAKPKTSTQEAPPRRVFKADPKNVAVARHWVDALRAGDEGEAASYFALPALVQNAGPLYKLTTRKAVRAFNHSLPCGARFVSAVAGDRYTIVTFELTERPHSPAPCGATGERAATAFRFRHGKISEWRRVIPPEQAEQSDSSA